MEIDTTKKGLYRGKILIFSRYASCHSFDPERIEKNGDAVAYGFWHRHDEKDVSEVINKELEAIHSAYRNNWQASGAMFSWDYKEYKR